MPGMNVDPENPANAPGPYKLKRLGFSWVRLVSRDSGAVRDYVDAAALCSVMVMAVITEQSGGYLCPADIYQLGNEPDLAGHGDTKSPAEYIEYWNLYRDTYPDVIMISAGLASGSPSWWRKVQDMGGLHGLNGMAVHPYAKTAEEAEALLVSYEYITSKVPIWVTEWNRPATEIPRFMTMLRIWTAGHAWFSWGGQQNPEFNMTPLQGRLLGSL